MNDEMKQALVESVDLILRVLSYPDIEYSVDRNLIKAQRARLRQVFQKELREDQKCTTKP